MVLDSSAIVSLILRDPDSGRILRRMQQASILAVAAPTLVETTMVLSSRLRRDARLLVNEFVRESELEVIPFGRTL